MSYAKQDSIAWIVKDLVELLFSRDLISSNEYDKFKERLWWADKKERQTPPRFRK
jgi:hypothetical protein